MFKLSKSLYPCAKSKLEQILLLKMPKFIVQLHLSLKLQCGEVGGFGVLGVDFCKLVIRHWKLVMGRPDLKGFRVLEGSKLVE